MSEQSTPFPVSNPCLLELQIREAKHVFHVNNARLIMKLPENDSFYLPPMPRLCAEVVEGDIQALIEWLTQVQEELERQKYIGVRPIALKTPSNDIHCLHNQVIRGQVDLSFCLDTLTCECCERLFGVYDEGEKNSKCEQCGENKR